VSSGSWPNFDAWLRVAWGSGAEFWSNGAGRFFGATNLVFGQNPPYYLDDFLAIYPKFFGIPTPYSGAGLVIGSQSVALASTQGLQIGQFLVTSGLPKGSVITGVFSDHITVSNVATATASGATLSVYQNTPVPIAVIQLYLNLAYASLVYKRWREQWCVAMGWFIAHYCTLYAQTDASDVMSELETIIHGEVPVGAVPGTVYTLSAAPPGGAVDLTINGLLQVPGAAYTLLNATITLTATTVLNDVLFVTWPIQQQALTSGQPNGAQIAAQGLAGGIQTNKSVGDVSVGYQSLAALEDWAAWGLTKYGQQLATMARVVGQGPMVIW
jgi:Protein of unknown function (DUF4054)